MNHVCEGESSAILVYNPDRSLFKCSYKHYTNFGRQYVRLDYEGNSTLNVSTETEFVFKVKRYGDLLSQCFLSLTLPPIWSPIYPPQEYVDSDGTSVYSNWAPYEFQWIDYIGAQIISSVRVLCGDVEFQRFSGNYILASTLRDANDARARLFCDMIGHVPDLVDPGNAGGRVNAYPNAVPAAMLAATSTDPRPRPHPSILGRELCIPLSAWFTQSTYQALPLVAVPNLEFTVRVTLRPVNEWFRIRDVRDYVNNFPLVASNQNMEHMQMYRFLNPPLDDSLDAATYLDKRASWDANIHLRANYVYLSEDESKLMQCTDQPYMVRQVRERMYFNVVNTMSIPIESGGLVSSWMFFLRRSDAFLRNEWTNYSNWAYKYSPSDVQLAPSTGTWANPAATSPDGLLATLGPGTNPDGSLSGLFISGMETRETVQDILVQMEIVCDGFQRETSQPASVYQWMEPWTCSKGCVPRGLYSYNFALQTDTQNVQPSGAMNLSTVKEVKLNVTTALPPNDPYAQTLQVCDPTTGEVIATNKPTWRLFTYTYDLCMMEECWNEFIFLSGKVHSALSLVA